MDNNTTHVNSLILLFEMDAYLKNDKIGGPNNNFERTENEEIKILNKIRSGQKFL